MIVMMIKMKCFCVMVVRRKVFSLITSQDWTKDSHQCQYLTDREQD